MEWALAFPSGCHYECHFLTELHLYALFGSPMKRHQPHSVWTAFVPNILSLVDSSSPANCFAARNWASFFEKDVDSDVELS